MAGVVHDVFGFHNVAGHTVQGAIAIGQTQFNGLLATPKQAAENIGRFLQTVSATVTNHLDELLVNLVQQSLCMGALGLALAAEGVQQAFVFTSGHQAAFHTELVHQAGEAKAVHQHTNAADDAGLVDKNLVCGHGDVVSRRSACFFHHRIHRLLVQGLETANFIVDHASLDRAATRRIDEQDDGLRTFVLEGLADRIHHPFGIGIGIGVDVPLDFNQGGV